MNRWTIRRRYSPISRDDSLSSDDALRTHHASLAGGDRPGSAFILPTGILLAQTPTPIALLRRLRRPRIVLARHAQLQLPHHPLPHLPSRIHTVDRPARIALPLLITTPTVSLAPAALLLGRSLARTADLARRRQPRLREALFLRQVLVLDQRLVAVGVQLGEEEVLHDANLLLEVRQRHRLVRRQRREVRRRRRGQRRRVLRLVGVVHAVLQQVQRHAERRQAELAVEPELLEAEKVLVQRLGKVAADKGLGAVGKGLGSVGAAVGQSGTLEMSAW